MKKKIIKIMKLSGFLFLLTVLQVWAVDSYSQRTKLTLDLKNVTVEDALKTIEDQSEFFFLYSPKMVDVSRKVDIELANKKVDFVLNQMFAGTGVDYVIKDRQIVITTDEMIKPFKKETLQQIVVTGKVTDEDGNTLPGVNILIKGTLAGTITNADGNYSIEVEDPNATLVFSFIGYRSQEVEISGRAVINITLVEEAIGLEEVVAIGYGTQRKSQITGAISSVASEQIIALPAVTNINQLLQGSVAGVVALQSSNIPGAGVTVRIRGRRSLSASNDPLYIVDGISYGSGIGDINPRNIESIEVLKDASSTAIYGSRGANGVVLVTTKGGGNYKTIVSYSGKYGITEARGTPPFMDPKDFCEYKKRWGSMMYSPETEACEAGKFTDWVDLILENGYVNTHNLSVRGGNEKTHLAVSADYYKKKGLIAKLDYSRYTLRVNLSHRVSDKFQIGANTQLVEMEQNPHSVWGRAVSVSPLCVDVYDEQGELKEFPTGDPLVYNPLFDIIDDNYIDERKRVRIFSSLFANYTITQHLNYRLNVGIKKHNERRGVFQGSNSTARLGGYAYASVMSIIN